MTTTRLKIIAEGQSDVHLIRRLMSHELTGDMTFYASQGAPLLSVQEISLCMKVGQCSW